MIIAQKVLVVAPAWIGDAIIAQALLQLLKQQAPESIIDVLAPSWSLDLFQYMPQVHRSRLLPFQHGQFSLSQRWQLGRQLRNRAYQHAIILPNSWKSAIIPYAAQIPIRTGWIGEYRFGLINDTRQQNRKKLPLLAQRYLSLGLQKRSSVPRWQLYRPQLHIDQKHKISTLKKFNIADFSRPILALCPGAEHGSSKRWPAHYFAQIAQEKLSQNWQVWLFGSQADQIITTAIQAATQNRCLDLGGKTSLLEAIDLLSCANTAVTNDSGLMHIAAAVQCPVVAIYGSSSPQFTPPLSDQKCILNLNLPCSPCFKRDCPLGHLNCLNQLLPKQVLQAIDTLS